jgi:hypothetical protein
MSKSTIAISFTADVTDALTEQLATIAAYMEDELGVKYVKVRFGVCEKCRKGHVENTPDPKHMNRGVCDVCGAESSN